MAYPTTINQLASSRFVPDDDPTVFIAPSGEPEVMNTYDASPPSGVFIVQHLCDSTQLDLILADYDTNGSHTATSFTWQRDNSSHDVYFDGFPEFDRRGVLYAVTVRLRVAN
jgi:hypothetical protein